MKRMNILIAWRESFDGRIGIIRHIVRATRNWRKLRVAVRAWRRCGSPAPAPPQIKRSYLRQVARQFGLRTFIETGTLFGDTVAATRDLFDRIDSVEIDPGLF
jgi:hypothetical protein